jgi:choline dehydrogenase-like flavoprotein
MSFTVSDLLPILQLSISGFNPYVLALSIVFVQTLFLRFYYASPNPDTVAISSSSKAYDYIIVGGGSSGCIIANRLSANPNTKVLLLEAGTSKQPLAVSIPAASPTLQLSEVDWKFKTEGQGSKSGKWLQDGIHAWPRGKVLGGCSAINYMAYVRGCWEDYRQFHAIAGKNKYWQLDNVINMFKRHEDHGNLRWSAYHGKSCCRQQKHSF